MSDLASRITDPREKPKEEPKEEPKGDSQEQLKDDAAELTPPATSDSSVTDAQAKGGDDAVDGPGLHEPEWDVEVSLSELQNNEATPFHSATTWQDLGLYVPLLLHRLQMWC